MPELLDIVAVGDLCCPASAADSVPVYININLNYDSDYDYNYNYNYIYLYIILYNILFIYSIKNIFF